MSFSVTFMPQEGGTAFMPWDSDGIQSRFCANTKIPFFSHLDSDRKTAAATADTHLKLFAETGAVAFIQSRWERMARLC
jgi:hypothetical protein